MTFSPGAPLKALLRLAAVTLIAVPLSSCVAKEDDTSGAASPRIAVSPGVKDAPAKTVTVEAAGVEAAREPAKDAPGDASRDASKESPASPSKDLARDAQAKPAGGEAAPGKCDAIYDRIKGFFASLPKDFGGLSAEAADKLAFDTERTIIVCGQFLAECDQHSMSPEVHYVTGRLLFSMSGRRRDQFLAEIREKHLPNPTEALRQKMAAYMGDVERLCRTAFERLAADHPYRPRALQLAGQACGEAEQHEEARKVYEQFLELYPKDAEVDRITLALARTLLDMEKFDDGIKVVKDGMDKFYASEQFPFFFEIYWKLVHSKGDLAGMEDCVKRVDTIFPLKLGGTSLKPAERDTYERFLGFNGFRKGYTRFARGDFAGAREAFREHLAAIDSQAEKLQAAKKSLKPEISVYRERSATCLKVVEELAGLPAPADFDLQSAWVTPKKVRVAESHGKVIGLVFRGANEERSAAFVGPVARFCATQPGMEMVIISYRKSGDDLSKQMDEMREELGRIGYEGAAGLDPDNANKTIFRRFQANVGSATFVILNRRGEVVWYMQDPRGVDVHFAETLLRQAMEK